MKPTIGLIFAHRRIINEDKTPMLYQVTRISEGVIFFRPLDKGHSECIEIERFDKIAMEESYPDDLAEIREVRRQLRRFVR
jgi:hypothetical protein